MWRKSLEIQMSQNGDDGRWRQDNGSVMYDVAHIFLRWLVYKFCVSDMWKQIFLCESNLGVIEILLLSLKVSVDSFDCY